VALRRRRLPARRLAVRTAPVASDTFDENRVGLDHLSFQVAARSDLDAAVTVLDERGIAHEGVKDIGMGYILEFRDPDNIALELFAPKS